MKKVGVIVGRVLIVLLVTIVVLIGTLFLALVKIKNGPSESAKNLFITTIMETGQLKFLASLVCTPEEIDEIVGNNAMASMDATVDTSLISMNEDSDSQDIASDEVEVFDENGVRIDEISGRTFFAKMMVIKNPSQVSVGSIYPWADQGKELDKLVSDCGAIGGVNGGLYVSSGNSGGSPLGVVVQDGQITYNSPDSMTGLYMIGLDKNNILIVKDLAGMNSAAFTSYVEEAGIRDAVAFQDEASDANNHFVPLIINGEARELAGQGSGANPRTAIGQRADGAILLLVTDGRGAAGHLGATASDLISIMQDYGAVNAANIDGGSSSSMVYKGEYEMTSVTFYYQNSSWRLPTAFIVKGGN